MICPIDQQPCTFPPDAHNGDRCNQECSQLMTTLPPAPARSGRRKDSLRGANTQPDFRGLTHVPGVTPAILDNGFQACFNGGMTNAPTANHNRTENEYRIPVGFSDLRAAIRHDARIAKDEGFKSVAQRAERLLEELDNIDTKLSREIRVGYKVEIVITPVNQNQPTNSEPTT